MSKKISRIAAWLLVLCLVITGFSLLGTQNAKASDEANEEKVVVKQLDVIKYRSETEFTAPEEAGYIFSGWYKDEGCKTPLGKNVREGEAWARFVPEQILSVKAQISANLLDSDADNDTEGAIRFVTTVDSLQYREIGFDLTINGKTIRKSSNMVYDKLYAIGETGGEPIQYTPQVFSSLSAYFKTWAFTNVPSSAYGTKITVQPVWVTLDGTTVYGKIAIKTVQQGIDAAFDNTPDISWYDETKSEYTITTVQELYGFAKLVNTDKVTFAGKIVKLGADIILNKGDAKDWEATAPENKWILVNGFNGTLDGQGHTISGIYVQSTAVYTGMFGTLEAGAVVKNLRLVNSYIEGNGSNTRSGVGSIAGQIKGTIDTVYSSAILKNSKRMTGGIAGMAIASTTAYITNCWFDGTIYNIQPSSGGILGGVYNATAKVEHCLNTGESNITNSASTGNIGQNGGLCGYVENGSAKLELNDSLNAGTIVKQGGVNQIGTISAGVAANMALNTNNVYGVTEFSANLFGYAPDTAIKTIIETEAKTRDELVGYNASQNTRLDFANYWALRRGDVPVLKSFDEGNLDVSWYTEDAAEYTITTWQQLYGFAELVNNQGVTFADKTVKLEADITLNEGNAKDWETAAPDNKWILVNGFNGTFDGQGHTISGIYVYSTAVYTGMFGTLEAGAVVKNLRLVNSYIEGNNSSTTARCGVGSIAGRIYGTIDTVYSSAIVKNSKRMTGGIVGMATASTTAYITNCWFDGKVYTVQPSSGGIVGGVYNATAKVEHCLNTGESNITNTAVTGNIGQNGGLCGYVENGSAKLELNDSLNAGTIVKQGGVNQIGTISAGVAANMALNTNNVYGVTEFSANLFGYAPDTATKIIVETEVKTRDELVGYNASQNTKLDFANYWVFRTDDVPVLKAFDKGDIDVSWYDADQTEFTFSTPQELYGFRYLCNMDNDYFKGKTVKLGVDITLNTGNAEDWDKTVPKNNWEPVNFNGILDGQGHTISGLYVKTEQLDKDVTYTGMFGTINGNATVRNLNLVNSYIEGVGTANTRCAVGSIAGQNHGTIDTVYSKAIVKNSALMTGGIAGTVTESDTSLITNCWFDGQLYGTGSSGGILGGTYGDKAKASIEHCLNTASINIQGATEEGKKYTAIGGLCGYIQGASSLKLEDSLNAGSYHKIGGTVQQTGSVLGALHNSGSLEVNNVYGVAEFENRLIGWKGTEKTYVQGEGTVFEMLPIADCYGRGAANLTFYAGAEPGVDGPDKSCWWVAREGRIPALASFWQIANE